MQDTFKNIIWKLVQMNYEVDDGNLIRACISGEDIETICDIIQEKSDKEAINDEDREGFKRIIKSMR